MGESGTGKKIVITTWGSFGDLHPYMALALELGRRGHRVTIATLPMYREKVEADGIGFHPVRPDLPSPEASVDLVRKAVDARHGGAYIFGTLISPHLEETYQDILDAVSRNGGADLLVSHMTSLAAPLVAEKTGIRWASSVLAPISFLSSYDPPSPPQLPALRRLLRLHPAAARAFGALGKRVTRRWVAPVEELRSKLGLPRGRHPIFEGQHSPRLVLALYSPLLGRIQPDFPPRTRITGFAFYDPPGASIAPDLDRFLDDCERAGEPPILFTLGSSAVWIADDFFRIGIQAARRLGRRALLLVADRSQLPPGPLPEGMAASGYAPYHLVMPRAGLVVHQGGIGTTAQALRAGRPALIMPFGHDTHDNARRVADLGVGRTLGRRRYTVERLEEALAGLIGSASYRDRAGIVGRQIRSEDGTGAASDAIQALLEAPA